MEAVTEQQLRATGAGALAGAISGHVGPCPLGLRERMRRLNAPATDTQSGFRISCTFSRNDESCRTRKCRPGRQQPADTSARSSSSAALSTYYSPAPIFPNASDLIRSSGWRCALSRLQQRKGSRTSMPEFIGRVKCPVKH